MFPVVEETTWVHPDKITAVKKRNILAARRTDAIYGIRMRCLLDRVTLMGNLPPVVYSSRFAFLGIAKVIVNLSD